MKNLFFTLIFSLFFTSCFADELIIEPDAGRTPILSGLNHASSIDLVMYGLTDEQMIHALIAAKNAGKAVQVLLEPHPYKSEDENLRAAAQLQAANVKLTWANATELTHQKTFIFDRASAMVMTFNLTHSAFKNERNFALTITDPTMVSEIERVFNADSAHQIVTVNNPNLFWSPNNSRKKMLALIQGAKSEIEMYAQDVSDYQVIGALANAARRGVKVEILLSEREKKRRGKFHYLRKAGAVVENSQGYLIHAKVLIVDRKRALLGSINFTAPSLDKNRELSVLTQDTSVIKLLLMTFNKDFTYN